MTDRIRPRTARERLIVALDEPGAREARELAERLGSEVDWVKIGLELFCSAGPGIVSELAGTGRRIFLDLKFHDIPNTVARAVAAVARLPVCLVNVHAAAGEEALRAAAEAAAHRSDLGLLAVTRLTSQAQGEAAFADVEAAAERALAAGLFGVVCPAPSAARLRARFGDRLALVCPGIRPAGTALDDQVHVATPRGAVEAGADWIVVGRPITRATDPAAAAVAIRQQLEGISRPLGAD